MKKNFILLLVMAVLFLVPFTSIFAITAEVPYGDGDYKSNPLEGSKEERIYDVNIINVDGEEVSTVTLSFKYGSAVEEFTCRDFGSFVATGKKVSDNAVTCTFTLEEGADAETDEKIKVGEVVMTVDSDADDEDCSIEYSLDTIKHNPETGSFVSYSIITIGLVAAFGIYFITNKKTQFKKI